MPCLLIKWSLDRNAVDREGLCFLIGYLRKVKWEPPIYGVRTSESGLHVEAQCEVN